MLHIGNSKSTVPGLLMVGNSKQHRSHPSCSSSIGNVVAVVRTAESIGVDGRGTGQGFLEPAPSRYAYIQLGV